MSDCAVVKWLRTDKPEPNPDKKEVTLTGKTEIWKDIVLPTFNRVQLMLVKSLGAILDPALLLCKLMQLQKNTKKPAILSALLSSEARLL